MRGASQAIVDGCEESEQGCRISAQCGFCARGKSCDINSGSRVALTVEGTGQVRMPLHGVPLCVCRSLSAILAID
jgi:hypothetical protein